MMVCSMQTTQTSLSIRSPTRQLQLSRSRNERYSFPRLKLSLFYLSRGPLKSTSRQIDLSNSYIMAETAPAPAATPATNAPAAPAGGATAGAPNTPADQNAASRGVPYYEKLRRELRDTIAHKRAMDRSMVSANPQVASPVLEGTYRLVTTHARRWENLVKKKSFVAHILTWMTF